MCIGFLLVFQIYIIVAAHSTDYILNARNDLDNLWANYTLNEDRISSIEISVNIYQPIPSKRTFQLIFLISIQNHCCGRNNSRDYEPIIGKIPKTCYLNQERTSENLFKEGCLDIVAENASKNGQIGLTVKWIIFFLEVSMGLLRRHMNTLYSCGSPLICSIYLLLRRSAL